MVLNNIVEKLTGKKKKGKLDLKLSDLTPKDPTKVKPIVSASDLTRKKKGGK